jgi:hypothetical protein
MTSRVPLASAATICAGHCTWVASQPLLAETSRCSLVKKWPWSRKWRIHPLIRSPSASLKGVQCGQKEFRREAKINDSPGATELLQIRKIVPVLPDQNKRGIPETRLQLLHDCPNLGYSQQFLLCQVGMVPVPPCKMGIPDQRCECF